VAPAARRGIIAAMNKGLRYSLIAAATLVAVILSLPFLIPVEAYRSRIENAAEHATGRTLHIEGPLRLVLFPQFGLRAEQITFANMPGGRAAAMASVGDIKLAIHIWPLFLGRVEVSEIVLDRPDIELEVDAQGQSNWTFAKAKSPDRRHGSSVTLPMDTQFSGIKINDGRIAYSNTRTGTRRAFDHVNADIGIARLDQPITVDGNLTVAGHYVDFLGRIVTIRSLISDQPTLLDFSLTSDMLQASFKGLLTPDGGVDGRIKLDTASLRGAALWLGEKLPPNGGLGALSLDGRFVSKDKVATLDPITLSLDHASMKGKLSVDRRGKVSAVSGTLSIDHLDLNPYLQTGDRPAHKPAQQKSEPGWSKEPINLTWLKEVNANLVLNIGPLRVRNLRLGHSIAKVSLIDGVLAARLDSISLYGGTGRAELDVDGRSAAPVFHNKLKFDHLALGPFLDDAMGVDRIEGNGSLSLDITAQGSNANAVMHTLSGKGVIAAGQGRFRGVDLGTVAKTIRTVLGDGATGDIASTDFHDMGASFALAHGVLTTKDFRLTGPLLQATGVGNVDIGDRSIDFRVAPKAVARGMSIGVPFHVKGSWDHVRYVPDLSGVMNGVIQNLANGRAPFKGLFGGGNESHDQGDQKKKKNAGDILKNMLGIH